VDGACVTHQSRRWEPLRDGCPFVDQLTRDSARAYRRAVDDPYFLGGPVSALSLWKSSLTP
jgi:hypothetical protein